MDTIYFNLVLNTLENAVCLEPVEDWGGGHYSKFFIIDFNYH